MKSNIPHYLQENIYYDGYVIPKNVNSNEGIVDTDQVIKYIKTAVHPGERPDQLSYRLYRTTDFFWTFDVINPELQNRWYLNDIQLEKITSRKYDRYVFLSDDHVSREDYISTVIDELNVVTSRPSYMVGKSILNLLPDRLSDFVNNAKSLKIRVSDVEYRTISLDLLKDIRPFSNMVIPDTIDRSEVGLYSIVHEQDNIFNLIDNNATLVGYDTQMDGVFFDKKVYTKPLKDKNLVDNTKLGHDLVHPDFIKPENLRICFVGTKNQKFIDANKTNGNYPITFKIKKPSTVEPVAGYEDPSKPSTVEYKHIETITLFAFAYYHKGVSYDGCTNMGLSNGLSEWKMKVIHGDATGEPYTEPLSVTQRISEEIKNNEGKQFIKTIDTSSIHKFVSLYFKQFNNN